MSEQQPSILPSERMTPDERPTDAVSLQERVRRIEQRQIEQARMLQRSLYPPTRDKLKTFTGRGALFAVMVFLFEFAQYMIARLGH